MGIWPGSGCGRGWVCADGREQKAAEGGGLGVAAVLDGMIEDWSVVVCRRLQAL